MEFFAFIPITASIVNLFLGVFVLTQGPKVKLNVIYFFWALALTIWNGGTALAFYARNYEEGLYVARFLQIGVICLPFLLYHLSVIISKQVRNNVLALLYAIMALFILSNVCGLFVKEVRFVKEIGAYYSVGGYPYWVFAMVCTLVSASAVISLHLAYKNSSPLLRRRIQLLLFSNYLIVLFGCNDILPIVGIYSYPFTKLQILPLGSAAAIFYGLIVGYSVLQDQLLDVRLSVGRATANMLRALQLTLVGFTLLIVFSVLAPRNTFTGLSFTLFAFVLVVTGLIGATIFPRLFGSGVDRIERMILGDNFEYQDRVAAFINTLPWYTKFNDLFEDLDTILTRTMGVAGFRIVLLDETGASFSVFRGNPEIASTTVYDIGSASKVMQRLRKPDQEYLYLGELPIDEQKTFHRELTEKFLFSDPEICFSFRAGDDPFGIAILTAKTNEDPYTKADLTLLTRLMRNLALVVNQIRLQDQLGAEQELDLLGRISKGLAHDLNNLLTPVATLLQVSTASASGDLEIDDLVRISERNVRIMKEYIRDSLFFSKTLKPQMTRAGVDDLSEAAVFVVSQRAREKGVTVEIVQEGSFQFVLDLVLLQRLISNLLSNAIDASPSGAVVILKMGLLLKPPNNEAWLQILVIDHGEGISPQNLEKMKAAFFTTKDSGDGKRGFGLGLAICRKIVHLHGGTLNISSQLGKGTTVQVELPNGSMPLLIAAEKSPEASSSL